MLLLSVVFGSHWSPVPCTVEFTFVFSSCWSPVVTSAMHCRVHICFDSRWSPVPCTVEFTFVSVHAGQYGCVVLVDSLTCLVPTAHQ